MTGHDMNELSNAVQGGWHGFFEAGKLRVA